MMDANLESRLKRIEAAIGDLKAEKSTKEQVKKTNQMLADASKKFMEKPNVKSAKVFLSELESSTKLAPQQTALAWTTVTVTIVTILSDDQG